MSRLPPSPTCEFLADKKKREGSFGAGSFVQVHSRKKKKEGGAVVHVHAVALSHEKKKEWRLIKTKAL